MKWATPTNQFKFNSTPLNLLICGLWMELLRSWWNEWVWLSCFLHWKQSFHIPEWLVIGFHSNSTLIHLLINSSFISLHFIQLYLMKRQHNQFHYIVWVLLSFAWRVKRVNEMWLKARRTNATNLKKVCGVGCSAVDGRWAAYNPQQSSSIRPPLKKSFTFFFSCPVSLGFGCVKWINGRR